MQKCVWVCIVKPTNRHLTIRAGFIVAGARYDGYLGTVVTFFLLQAVFEFPCEFPCDKVEGRQENGVNVPSSYTKTYEQLHFTGNIQKR